MTFPVLGFQRRPAFALGKVIWNEFSLILSRKCSDYLSSNSFINYDLFIYFLQSSIIAAGGKIVREKKFYSRSPTTWWNEECIELIAQKRNLFHIFKGAPNISNSTAYVQCSASVNSHLKQIKIKSFEDYCSTLNAGKDISSVWSTVRAFQKRSITAQRTDEYSLQRKKAALAAFDKAIPLPRSTVATIGSTSSAVPDSSVHFPDNYATSADVPLDDDILLRPFSMPEFEAVLSSLKCKAAPGPDLISNKIIAKLTDDVKSILLGIFNKMFNSGIYPKDWKHYYMCFLPKPGKKHEFRPISLASNLAKVFEKLIQLKLEWWLENNNLFPKFQFGFRRGLSCRDNLVFFTSCILESFSDRAFLGAVCVDIKGAFGNVNTNKLIKILNGCGVPPRVVNFINHMIECRTVEGYYNGDSLGSRTACRGVPQGSVLSPILFNMYVKYCCQGLDPCVIPLMYADDLIIFTKQPNLKLVYSELQNALHLINKNLIQLDLEIAIHKTHFCISLRFVLYISND